MDGNSQSQRVFGFSTEQKAQEGHGGMVALLTREYKKFFDGVMKFPSDEYGLVEGHFEHEKRKNVKKEWEPCEGHGDHRFREGWKTKKFSKCTHFQSPGGTKYISFKLANNLL